MATAADASTLLEDHVETPDVRGLTQPHVGILDGSTMRVELENEVTSTKKLREEKMGIWGAKETKKNQMV
jgi:hypothetical protein